MFIKFKARAFGFGLPVIGGGLNVATSIDILLRAGAGGPISVYRLKELLDLQSDLNPLLLSTLETDWCQINSAEHPWICSLKKYLGREFQFEVLGLAFGAARADIQLSVLENSQTFKPLMIRALMKSFGIQTGNVRCRGLLESVLSHQTEVCS